MARLLTCRYFSMPIFRQPFRFMSWCSKEKEKTKDSTVKHAAQESLYKNYELNRCQKTVFCPGSRQDCKQDETSNPCQSQKKFGVTDALGKLIWLCIKGGIVIAVVYVTIDAGVWRGPDETYELGKSLYKRLLEVLELDDSRMPTVTEVTYNTQQVWNKGVKIVFNRVANPYVDYDTYMARRKALL